MQEASIFIFRHGQSTFNKARKFTGWKNPNLTSLGIKQAKTIAQKLKNKKIGLAFQTRLKRSKSTLKEVLKYHPECHKIYTDNRMIERSYGSLAGKTHEEIINKHGLDKYNQWHRGYKTPPPGGESFADVEKRVKSFIKHLKVVAKKEKVNVAISAHGNSIRLFRKIMEHASEKQCVSWTIPYDNYIEYKVKV